MGLTILKLLDQMPPGAFRSLIEGLANEHDSVQVGRRKGYAPFESGQTLNYSDVKDGAMLIHLPSLKI